MNKQNDEKNDEIIALKKIIQQQKDEIFQLRNIINDLPNDVYWKRYEGGKFIYSDMNNTGVNSLRKMGFHWDRSHILGKTDYDLFAKETADIFSKNDLEIICSRKTYIKEEAATLPSGKKIVQLSTKRPLFNKKEEVIGIVGISVDITDRKKSEIAKQEFLKNMAHDIRTPLAGIIGLAQLQTMGLDSLKESKVYGQMIHGAGNQLLELLNAVINLIDTEHMTDAMKAEPLDLSELAKELCALMEPSICMKGLKFKLELDQNLPFIISDHIKLKRVLLNILSNAVKFTKEGKIVFSIKLLDIENNQAKVEIIISDTGIGIAKENLDKIYDRFYRAHSSYLAEYSGHGVGLYLVKEILAVLGGEIKVSSKEGRGTCFTLYFKFPLAGKHSEKIEENVKLASGFQTNVVPTGPVLIAEDNPLVLHVIKNLLDKAGYEVITTKDGKAALEALQNNRFAWALLDIGLPELRGTEAAQRYREWEKENNKPRLPIFALTGHGVEEVEEESREAGIDQIFTKPLTDKIIQEIEAVLYS
jgi:two-component system, OmpR family, aerobic respiration control sensor histidine kinase ArcB